MKFQWTSIDRIDEELLTFCIELEYQLRPRIERFLIAHPENDGLTDFSGFRFDVDLNLQQVNIDHVLPEFLSSKMLRDFDKEINLGFARSLFSFRGIPSKFKG